MKEKIVKSCAGCPFVIISQCSYNFPSECFLTEPVDREGYGTRRMIVDTRSYPYAKPPKECPLRGNPILVKVQE